MVTATVTEMTNTGEIVTNINWLINPGVEIPEGAAEIHGITTEKARADGVDPEAGLHEIADALRSYDGHPLVVMNANYDLTLLNSELERYSLPAVDWSRFNIVDPLVLDRALDRYRKGSRKLVNMAEHYGVVVDESKAHNSEYDNFMAGSVAIAIVRKYEVTNSYLRKQPELYKEWATGFEKYLRKKDPDATVDKEWPIRKKTET